MAGKYAQPLERPMMIKEICKDTDFLSRPAEPATPDDAPVAEDLRDTLASIDDCVCLAANQIGSTKAVIAYEDNGRIYTMFNPKLKMSAQPFMAQEGCLSLEEPHTVKRFKMITVTYQIVRDGAFAARKKRLSGYTAEAVQHALDHVAGKLV